MKITDITTVKLSYTPDRPMADAIHYMGQRNLLLVQVHTDEGLTGIGEAASYGGPMESTEAVILHELKPRLIGEDPFQVERLFRKMTIPSHQHGRKGILFTAVSGIDIALWDIIGKATNTPLYRLLGGYREKVEAYASAGFYAEGKSPDDLANEMAGYVEAGFKGVKMKIGRNLEPMLNPLHNMDHTDFATVSLEEDIERVAKVREAIGPKTKLAIDANNAWTPSLAIKMARAFEPYNIEWFEEPVDTEDIEGSALVAHQLDMPVSGYETEVGLYGFRELITRRAVDIVQPDVIWSGGVTECKKIAAFAHAYGLPVIPHVFSSAVSLVANLHFIASIPNGGLLEFDQNPNPLRSELFNEEIKIDAEGRVNVPNRPGLGVTLNEDTVKKYKVDTGATLV
ncbi:MAG TPA: mandelate racemase/muconate lactonizing enzyme family protein [Bacillales bacterium]|nr:mandelate racemase/muconate lactonizing enzyme family protein [Bacillales bacterium]